MVSTRAITRLATEYRLRKKSWSWDGKARKHVEHEKIQRSPPRRHDGLGGVSVVQRQARTRIRQSISPHPWSVFQARLLDNQEGANTSRYVTSSESSRRDVSYAERLGELCTDTIVTAVEISTMDNRPRGV